MIGTCKLCDQPDLKLVDSHVIPKGLYEGLQDSAGRVTQLISDRAYPKRIPQGIYDQIVCLACESKFGPWDQQIQQVLQPENLEKLRDTQGCVKGWQVKKFDYEMTQLFFVSLAWRIHAANRDPFAKVSLEPSLAHIAKASICAGSVGNASCFSVVLSGFNHDASIAFMDPVQLQYSGVSYWRVPFPRFSAEIKVDLAPAPALLEALSLKPNHGWYIGKRDFEKSQEMKIMKSMLKAQGLSR